MNSLSYEKTADKDSLKIGSGHYGVETIVMNYCGLKKIRPIIGTWQHGVLHEETILNAIQCTDSFIKGKLKRKYPFFVANNHIKSFLLREGYENVHAIGLPIIYAKKILKPVNRSPGTLLLIPSHSSAISPPWDFSEYARFVEEVGKNFSRVTVSLHYNDYNQNTISLFSKIKNVNIVLGAVENRQDSISRMAYLFSTHEYASTNFISSGIVYAAHFGCKVSISGPSNIDWQIKDAYNNADVNHRIEDYVEGLFKLEKKYDFLNCELPKINSTNHQNDWVDELLGTPNIQNSKRLSTILGLGYFNKYKKLQLSAKVLLFNENR